MGPAQPGPSTTDSLPWMVENGWSTHWSIEMHARHDDRHPEFEAQVRNAEELVADVLARVSTVAVMIAAAFLGASF